jgi:2-iminobutanoate/2-iminopropanoate deaminase
MSNKIIETKSAPAPIGPYSQAVQNGNLLFVSGQIALNPETGALENRTVQEEAVRVMENLKAILNEAGTDFENVVKTTIFLTDMNLFAEVNDIYAGYFKQNFPARETVAVKGLPKNVNVEISMIVNVP